MTKIAVLVTVAGLLAARASGQALAVDEDADAFDRAFAEAHGAIHATQQRRMEAISVLRRNGSRYEKAIRLIEGEASKPSWGWSDDCMDQAVDDEPFPGS